MILLLNVAINCLGRLVDFCYRGGALSYNIANQVAFIVEHNLALVSYDTGSGADVTAQYFRRCSISY